MADPVSHIGPYEIVREIGRGGMGVVLLGRDTRLERDVAIKSLAPEFGDDEERLARFRRESRIIAQLNHAHIAQVYHLIEQGGQMHLVLEYVPGRSLAEIIERDGALGIESALDLGVQIARAMDAAHFRGIVHRDLKPANIRVTPEGIAKVLDFGIARFSRRAASDAAVDPGARETESGRTTMAGTPGYMAPEQAAGERVDGRADVFSFGCILYECLTGAPAFPGMTVGDRLAAVRLAAPDESRLPATTPDGVRDLLRRCLAKHVGDRLPDIAEARAILEAALGRHATRATGDTAGPRGADNLPAPTTSFVGRAAPLEELARCLADVRLLTLTGPGGAGKTRLALELGRRERERFADGVHLVELAATANPDLVPAALAVVLGVKDRPRSTTTEVLCEHLAARTALLILDNCEHVLDAVSDLVLGLLRAAPSLRILATSREALKIPGEHVWPVPSLSLPTPDDPGGASASEAVALFADRARAVRPAFALSTSNVGAVARICRRLDGMPLAIELAAARVRGLTPEEIDDRLDDRLRLLTQESRGVPERHRTLRAALDWSYCALRDREQRMMRALSVFAGGWTLDGALAVGGPGGDRDGADLDDLAVIDVLTRLVDTSLVVADHTGRESRYRLLETVRQYAAERLDAAGETHEAVERHVAFHLDLAERAEPALTGPDQAATLARLEAEHENLLAALHACEGNEDHAEHALRLCGAMRWFWRLHGHFKIGFEACRRALTLPGAQAATDARAAALQTAAGMALGLGDYERTTRFAAEALDIERVRHDLDGVARALNSLGNAAYYRGDLDEAMRRHEEGLVIRREEQNEPGIATSLNNLGNVATDRGDHAEAGRLYEEALAINRRMGNRASEAINLNNLGLLAFFRGDLAEAGRLHDESLSIRRGLADRHGIAESLTHLSTVARHEGDLAGARRRLGESLTVRRDLGDRLGLAETLDEVAMLAARLEAVEVAARVFGASERLRERIGAPRPSREQTEVDECLAPARDAIGHPTFEEIAGAPSPLKETVIDVISWLSADGDDAAAPTRVAGDRPGAG